jgi:hypothetical protein
MADVPLFGPDSGLPEADQYPDTSFTQHADEEEEKGEEEEYDDMDDFGEQYELWAKQAEMQKPAIFQSLPAMGEDGFFQSPPAMGEDGFFRGGMGPGNDTAAAERATAGDGQSTAAGQRSSTGPARRQPSHEHRQRTSQHPILKKLTHQATSGAARPTTPPAGLTPHLKSALFPNPGKQPARKADSGPTYSPGATARANYKRPRSAHDRGARHVARSMPDSDDEELDATAALDYPSERLRGMSYAELRSEPFDAAAPRSGNEDGKMTSGESKESVAARVEAGMDGTPEQQELLFNALSIDEWEEAGEWFVGRFAEVVRRMVEVRREKRRTAQDAESAVAARNDAVEAGERETRVVLEGMKERGREILERRQA